MIEILVLVGVGFALGMYVASQIEAGIAPKQNQKLLENMNKINNDGTTKREG